MKTIYCSGSNPRFNPATPVVTFNAAMKHYRDVIEGQRIRCMMFQFSGKGLKQLIKSHFFIIRDERDTLKFEYEGIPYIITFLDGIIGEVFALSESY